MYITTVHTMNELKLTGNCLKGSRPLLSFDPVRSLNVHSCALQTCIYMYMYVYIQAWMYMVYMYLQCVVASMHCCCEAMRKHIVQRLYIVLKCGTAIPYATSGI